MSLHLTDITSFKMKNNWYSQMRWTFSST